MHVKYKRNNEFVDMCGPQIRICFFSFRPIASIQLNSLTTIVNLCRLGGTVVTHPLWVQKVQKHIVCQKIIRLSFSILIYLVYLIYCEIYDRL